MLGCVQDIVINAIGGSYIDQTKICEDTHTRCELINKKKLGQFNFRKMEGRNK
jgi:hypothetical protein